MHTIFTTYTIYIYIERERDGDIDIWNKDIKRERDRCRDITRGI